MVVGRELAVEGDDVLYDALLREVLGKGLACEWAWIYALKSEYMLLIQLSGDCALTPRSRAAALLTIGVSSLQRAPNILRISSCVGLPTFE